MTLLILKHFIVDFPLQGPYQWMNKGKYGHLGGILHASLHAIGSVIVLAYFTPKFFTLALFDAILHYHIDWAKVNINNRYGWKSNENPQFWWLTGLDQMLHYLTYVLMILNV